MGSLLHRWNNPHPKADPWLLALAVVLVGAFVILEHALDWPG